MSDANLMKCPQCGAAREGAKCAYCGAVFDDNAQKLVQAEIAHKEMQSEYMVLSLSMENYEKQVSKGRKALGERAGVIAVLALVAFLLWRFWIQPTPTSNVYYIGQIALGLAIIAAVEFCLYFFVYGNYRKAKKRLAEANQRLVELRLRLDMGKG